MFISRKTHEQFVKLLAEQYEARLVAYQEQISDLKKLVFTPTSAENIPLIAREADAIITSNSDMPDPEEYNQEPSPESLRELDLIVSGEHEQGI